MTTIVNDVSDVGIYNIVADQGTTFMRSITYKNSAGTAIDLGVGASAQMKVRKSYPATLNRAAYRDDDVLWATSGDNACSIGSDLGAKITKSNHNFSIGDNVFFTPTFPSGGIGCAFNSSGNAVVTTSTMYTEGTVVVFSGTTLPTGINGNQGYYVRRIAGNTSAWNISTLISGALTTVSSSGNNVYFERLYYFSATAGGAIVVSSLDHPFQDNDTVKFTAFGTLPSNISQTFTYYVRNSSANTFELSLFKDGASITSSVVVSGTDKTATLKKGLPAPLTENQIFYVGPDRSTDYDPTNSTFRVYSSSSYSYLVGSSSPVVSGVWSAAVNKVNQATESLTLTTATGIIDIKIPSSYMSAIPAGIYDYDLEITLGTSPGVGEYGDTIKIIRGLFEVRQEMTY